ncbi:MAG TPA: HAD-IA family hydrolase [Dehalococcoidia bacterium]|nr:HAD-IA family hydrolase [Dehalococcoidia bacterium]
MNDSPTHLLLFDLGHVLVEVTGARDITPYLKAPLRWDGTDWPAMEAWEAFEKGLLTAQEFSERFVEQANLSLDAPAFLANFTGWTRGLLPGAKETLDALRPRFRLAALSNSNEVHWRRNAELGVPQLFERSFTSHEIGVRKPAREIYEHVLTEMEVVAADVTFFDDQQPNVDAAKQAGMNAHRVVGVEELRACLRELGYL